MTTITLESIQAEQTRVNSLIDAYVKQTRASEYRIPEAIITLNPGERYAGIVLGDDGELSHHLIQLPGDNDDAPWADQVAWARSIGGALPTQREQSLLFANLRGFQPAAYWSAETHPDDSSYARCQYFDYGYQVNDRKSAELRAVAVRRLVIE
jgi:hypothetical protein